MAPGNAYSTGDRLVGTDLSSVTQWKVRPKNGPLKGLEGAE